MKTIVFDFDGTIANTLENAVQIYNDLAPRYGCKTLQPSDVERIRNGRPRDFMHEFGITYWKLPFLLWSMKRELKGQIASLPLQKGIFEAIRQLQKRGVRLGILTSNSAENVHAFLTANGLEGKFDFVISHRGLFSKHRPLLKLKRKNDSLLYVGDEVRDIDSAKRAGVVSIGVTWGFQTEKALKASSPDYLINEADELLKLM